MICGNSTAVLALHWPWSVILLRRPVLALEFGWKIIGSVADVVLQAMPENPFFYLLRVTLYAGIRGHPFWSYLDHSFSYQTRKAIEVAYMLLQAIVMEFLP